MGSETPYGCAAQHPVQCGYDRDDHPTGAMFLVLAVVQKRISDALWYRRGRTTYLRSEYAYTEALRDAVAWLDEALPGLDISTDELFDRLDAGTRQAAEAMGMAITLAGPKPVRKQPDRRT